MSEIQDLLPFFALVGFSCRRAPKPHSNKSNPTQNSRPYASNPNPSAADLPAPRPLVVRKVSYCYLPLDVKVGEEWPFVIDLESEDTMLVWESESGGENGTIHCL